MTIRTSLGLALILFVAAPAWAQTNGGNVAGGVNQGTNLSLQDMYMLRMLRGRSHGVKVGQPQIYGGYPGVGQMGGLTADNGNDSADTDSTDKRSEAKRIRDLRKESAKAEAEKKAEERKAKAEKDKAARIQKAKDKAKAEKEAALAKAAEEEKAKAEATKETDAAKPDEKSAVENPQGPSVLKES